MYLGPHTAGVEGWGGGWGTKTYDKKCWEAISINHFPSLCSGNILQKESEREMRKQGMESKRESVSPGT